MKAVNILFYFFITLAALTALGILLSKNVLKSALLLLISLLSVSALYVLSLAEFVAVTQILIYAGGILVVIIFGIMLTTKISGRPLVVENANIFSGAIAGISMLVLLIRYLPSESIPAGTGLQAQNISVIGLKIFSAYSLPFEVAGILLLIALIGAAVVTSPIKTRL